MNSIIVDIFFGYRLKHGIWSLAGVGREERGDFLLVKLEQWQQVNGCSCMGAEGGSRAAGI